jgi:hypothetical protein
VFRGWHPLSFIFRSSHLRLIVGIFVFLSLYSTALYAFAITLVAPHTILDPEGLPGEYSVSVGGGSPAGDTGQIQFNDEGSFGASSNFFWDKTNNRLGVGTNAPAASLHLVAKQTLVPGDPGVPGTVGETQEFPDPGGVATFAGEYSGTDTCTVGIGVIDTAPDNGKAHDRFIWGYIDGPCQSGSNDPTEITPGTPQELENGVTVTFDTGTGHNVIQMDQGFANAWYAVLTPGTSGTPDSYVAGDDPFIITNEDSDTLFRVANDGYVTISQGLVVGKNIDISGVSYTWPNMQAAGAGYVLTNNGTGGLSWEAPSGGSSSLFAGLVGFGSQPAASDPDFTGSGMNDLTVHGTYTGTGTTNYTATIVGTNVPQFLLQNEMGIFNVGDTVTQTTGAGAGSTAIIASRLDTGWYTLSNIQPVGGGFLSGETVQNGAGASAQIGSDLWILDTVEVSDGIVSQTSSTNFPSFAGIQGVTISFTSATGHTIGDHWDWSETEGGSLTGNSNFAWDNSSRVFSVGDLANAHNGTKLIVDDFGAGISLINAGVTSIGQTGGGLIAVNGAGQTINFNGAYTFPFGDGSNGQVLTTNGSGVLSWENSGGSGGFTIDNSMDPNMYAGVGSGGNLATMIGGNLFIGQNTGYHDTSGEYNTFLGFAAGTNITTGSGNTFLGFSSGVTSQTGMENTLLGNNTDVLANNTSFAIALGFGSTAGTSQFVAGSVSAPINDVYFGDGIRSTLPDTVTIHGTGGQGSNAPGGTLIIAGGVGTFSATPGSILFETGVQTIDTDSDVPQVLAERLRINGTGAIRFNDAYTFPTDDGVLGQVLSTDGNGNLSWSSNGLAGNPAGLDTEIQFNNNGSFGSNSAFFFDSNYQNTSLPAVEVNGYLRTYSLLLGAEGDTLTLSKSSGTGYPLIFPGSQGSTGQTLVNNGNNGLYWADAGGDSIWTSDNGGNLFNSGAGNGSISGLYSIYIGSQAGHLDTSGYNNVFIGRGAGSANTSGYENVFFGHNAGITNITGHDVIAIGDGADVATSATSNAIALGPGAIAGDYQLVTGGVTSAYFGNGVTNGSPVAFTLNATGGAGTNIAGASLVIAGGIATGNASGGSIQFQTSDSGISGVDPQSLTTKFMINADGTINVGNACGFSSEMRMIVCQNGVVTGGNSIGLNLINEATDTTATANKYGLYVQSHGVFDGDSNTTNNFGIYISSTSGADNNYDIYAQSGAYLSTGGTWTDASSKALKENYADLDKNDILEKISTLNIQKWNYISQGPTVIHIGPYAEDFKATFNIGESDKALATLDTAGVALIGIQALDIKVKSLEALISGGGTTVIEQITDAVLHLKSIVFGTAETPSGFTMYDTVTHEPYCVTLANGDFVKTSGECGSSSVVEENGGTDGGTGGEVITGGESNPSDDIGGTGEDSGGTSGTDSNEGGANTGETGGTVE